MVSHRLNRRAAAAICHAALAATLAAGLHGQQQWVNVSGPTDGTWIGGFDARRGRFVRFAVGSDPDTWETAGLAWVGIPTGTPPFGAPALRNNYGVTYDRARSRLLMFGGRAVSTFGDMWSWDGIEWIQVPGAAGPPRRESPAMAYDPVRDRVVLFGGVDGTVTLDDTWEYDGIQWNHQVGALATGSATPQMAFDEVAGSMVLLSVGTLRWNGTSWAGINGTTTTPTSRLCFDRAQQQLLLSTADAQARVQQLQGSNWTQVFQGPEPVMRATFYFDPRRNRSILASQESIGDVWSWDGAQMARESVPMPHERANQAWFDDPVRGQSVLFGGSGGLPLDDTWLWDGHVWTNAAPPTRPSARASMAATFDTSRGVGLLFGGTSPSGFQGDLWGWNGATWALLSAAGGPQARVLGALSFDSTRGRAVLCGGLGSTGFLSDTWEWDGGTWVQMPVASPPSVIASGMAFDPLRNRTVLYLGLSTTPQTWEWDGAQWQQVSGAGGPPLSSSTSLAFDPTVGKVAMIGSLPGFGLWDFDGATWSQRPTASALTLRGQSIRLTFSSRRQRLQCHNGRLVKELQDVAGAVVPYGRDCGSPRSVSMVRARPTLGDSGFALDAAFRPGQTAFLGLSTVAANQPLPGGCSLLLGPLLALAAAVTDADGLASWSIPIPDASFLLGVMVFAQAAAVEPSAPGGGVLTQGLQLVVGR